LDKISAFGKICCFVKVEFFTSWTKKSRKGFDNSKIFGRLAEKIDFSVFECHSGF
jgi:hypothetical protein